MSNTAAHAGLRTFEIVGRGKNRASDGSIQVEAGWDSEATIEAAVDLQISHPLKSARIQAEFKGWTEARFEMRNPTKLAVGPETANYKVNVNSRLFQNVLCIIYDSRHPLPTTKGDVPLSLPFSIKLPKNNLPPSFQSTSGSIEYSIKCSISFQEELKLFRSHREIEVPVTVNVPSQVVAKLLKNPSTATQEDWGSHEKAGFKVFVPNRVTTIGGEISVEITIFSTPPNAKLRLITATMRPQITYLSSDKIGVQATFPRPLADWSQIVNKSIDSSEPIIRKIFLTADPEMASVSFKSVLISVETVLRVQIILDTSETPNVSVEIPIVLLPQAPGSNKSNSNMLPVIVDDMARNTALHPDQRSVFSGGARSVRSNVDGSTELKMPVYQFPELVENETVLEDALSVEGLPMESNIRLHPQQEEPQSSSIRRQEFSLFNAFQEQEPDIDATPPNSLPRSDFNQDNLLSHRPTEPYFTRETTLPSPNNSISENGKFDETADFDTSNVDSWSVETVADFLRSLKISEDVVRKFSDNAIDGSVFVGLSPEDLKTELGLTALGVRRKIEIAIEILKSDQI
ncbi:hypothetical protein HDU82_002718 [Entophlyctis luteolus]|nr:hypothetical protein HDU82_002718 [Entophlyctis luteolus]